MTSLRGLVILSSLLAGCAEMASEPNLSAVSSDITVNGYVSSTCSTSVVIGLSKQIADQVALDTPNSLVKFQAGGNLTFTSNAVLPYMSASAKTALMQVTASSTIQVNSGFRTVAQQYLIYKWFQAGRCGITKAATPGNSNHQSGRALDVQNYSGRITALSNKGWAHDVPGDPVHFDYLSSPDIRGKDVLAFQELWNRNNPNDTIPEDGDYGSMTEARLKIAPATGFALGPAAVDPGNPDPTDPDPTDPPDPTNPPDPDPTNPPARVLGADIVSVDGPDKIAPSAHAAFSITLLNFGTVEIPATTKILTVDGQPSSLYDPDSWTSSTQVGTVGSLIAAGQLGTIDIDVISPDVTEETPLFSQFKLMNGSDNFGTIDVAVTVTPNGDDGNSSEGGDQHDDGTPVPDDGKADTESPLVTGGCSAGGTASGLMMFAPLALFAIRRRRR